MKALDRIAEALEHIAFRRTGACECRVCKKPKSTKKFAAKRLSDLQLRNLERFVNNQRRFVLAKKEKSVPETIRDTFRYRERGMLE